MRWWSLTACGPLICISHCLLLFLGGMSRHVRGGDAGVREPLLSSSHLEEEKNSEDEGEATGFHRLSG